MQEAATVSRCEHLFHHLARLRLGYRRSQSVLFVLGTVCALAGCLLPLTVTDLVVHLSAIFCWTAWTAIVLILATGAVLVYRTAHRRVSYSAMAVLVRLIPSCCAW